VKIATWNVNSLRLRLPQVLDWLGTSHVDVMALQETKTQDCDFPRDVIHAHGLHVAFSGQRTYNGVAILSRLPLHDVETGIPGLADEQKRVVAATVNGVRVINVYVPNGQTVASEKYDYKLMWLEALTEYVRNALSHYEKLVILGDFNIAPEDRDVHDPKAWEGSVLVSEAERHALSKLKSLPLLDVFRQFHQADKSFSWWDYRAAGFRRNAGLRIDLILASASLSKQCKHCSIDMQPRTHERPSDHTPVMAEFDVVGS